MDKRILMTAGLLFALAGCDGKIPESDVAKKIGSMPKQIVDSAASRTNAALQQGESKNRDALEKAEKTK